MFYFRGSDSEGREVTILDDEAAISFGLFAGLFPSLLLCGILMLVSWLTGISFMGMWGVFCVFAVVAVIVNVLDRFGKLTPIHYLHAIPLTCFFSLLAELSNTPLVNSHKKSPASYSINDLLSRSALGYVEIARTTLILLGVSAGVFLILFFLSPKINKSGAITNMVIAAILQIVVASFFFSFQSKLKACVFLGVESLLFIIVEILACCFAFIKPKKKPQEPSES